MRVYNPPSWKELLDAYEKDQPIRIRVETGNTHPDDSLLFNVIGFDPQRNEVSLVNNDRNWVLSPESRTPEIYEDDGSLSSFARFCHFDKEDLPELRRLFSVSRRERSLEATQSILMRQRRKAQAQPAS